MAQGAPTELRSELQQGGRLLVRVDAPAQAVLAAIQNVPGVRHAETGDDGIIATPTDINSDPRSQIARAIVDKGWDLLELRPLAINLEEIFLELTRHRETAQVEEAIANEQAAETEEIIS